MHGSRQPRVFWGQDPRHLCPPSTRLADAGFPALVVAGSADEVVPPAAAAAAVYPLSGHLLVPVADAVADEAAAEVIVATRQA